MEHGELNYEQRRAVEVVLQGSNLFLTGSGGTGKSFTLATIVAALVQKGVALIVTATTGISAVTINGVTTHSFTGFGIGNETKEELKRLATSKRLRDIWCSVDTLIIDEISMLKPDYLEKMALVAQVARQSTEVFGGIQLVLVGDFFQLPPVYKKIRGKPATDGGREFCFESPVWRDLRLEVVELKQVFRQSDATFVQCLQRIRWGTPTADDMRLLTSRLHADVTHDGIRPTFLHSRVDDVNRLNQDCLDKLTTPARKYHAVDGFIYPKETAVEELPPRNRVNRLVADLRRNMPAEEDLTLKVGAQVILLTKLNMEHHLVNGSRGVVVRFTESEPVYPVVRFAKVEATIRAHMWKHTFRAGIYAYVAQVPLKLAYAYTIHKSQSQSMDCVQLQLDDTVFEEGQAYVALSRVTSLKGLTLSAFNPSCIRAHPKVVTFYRSLGSSAPAVLQKLMSRLASANKEEEKHQQQQHEDEESAAEEEEEEMVEEEDDDEEEEEEVVVVDEEEHEEEEDEQEDEEDGEK